MVINSYSDSIFQVKTYPRDLIKNTKLTKMFVFIFLEGHLYMENSFCGGGISPDCGGMNRGIFYAKI